jgi:hypothetical protein
MRMPWETVDVMPWIVCTKIIEQQEWIERRYLPKSECPLQVDTGSFNGGLGLDDLPDLSVFLRFAPPRSDLGERANEPQSDRKFYQQRVVSW